MRREDGEHCTQYLILGPEIPELGAVKQELARFGAEACIYSSSSEYRWLDRAKVFEPIVDKEMSLSEFNAYAETFLAPCREREAKLAAEASAKSAAWDALVAGRPVAAVNRCWETGCMKIVGSYSGGKLDYAAYKKAQAGLSSLIQVPAGPAPISAVGVNQQADAGMKAPTGQQVFQSKDSSVLYVITKSTDWNA